LEVGRLYLHWRGGEEEGRREEGRVVGEGRKYR
jgi:hypothetical protein